MKMKGLGMKPPVYTPQQNGLAERKTQDVTAEFSFSWGLLVGSCQPKPVFPIHHPMSLGETRMSFVPLPRG